VIGPFDDRHLQLVLERASIELAQIAVDQHLDVGDVEIDMDARAVLAGLLHPERERALSVVFIGAHDVFDAAGSIGFGLDRREAHVPRHVPGIEPGKLGKGGRRRGRNIDRKIVTR
jgi:hypothetical protein